MFFNLLFLPTAQSPTITHFTLLLIVLQVIVSTDRLGIDDFALRSDFIYVFVRLLLISSNDSCIMLKNKSLFISWIYIEHHRIET